MTAAAIYTGLNKASGEAIADLEHLRQSISDILTTPLGTRVMRRDYGSRLFDLIDAPINNQTLVDIYAATAEALRKWEPRLKLERVRVTRPVGEQAGAEARAGQLSISVEGALNGRAVLLEDVA